MINKKRIAIFTHNYPATSKERKDAGVFIYDFAHELRKHCQVFIFCPDFGAKKENYKRVPVKWFFWDKKNEKFGDWRLFNPIYIFKFFKLIIVGQNEATKFVKANKIDYILACWSLPSSVIALIVNLRLGTKYACWSLGSDINKYLKIPILAQFIRLSMKKADRLFANSFDLINKIKRDIGRTSIFLPAITNLKEAGNNFQFVDKKKHFIFVGRLEVVKGPDVLIRAALDLVKERKDFIIDILGDGSLREKLTFQSADLLNKNIVFHGWADAIKVSRFMSAADCLVVPSRSESLPLVIIEAANRRLPVIAANVGDCKRIIDKYKIGLSIAKESPKMLSQAMNKFLRKKIKINDRGFSKMVKDFSQESAAKYFLKKIE